MEMQYFYKKLAKQAGDHEQIINHEWTYDIMDIKN